LAIQTSQSAQSSHDSASEKSCWLMAVRRRRCGCFVVVSCLGYLTGKMFDQIDEVCIEDMPAFAIAASNFGCPRNFFIRLFPN